MDLGSIIQKLRNKREMSQEKLAENTGVSLSAIRAYEHNTRNPKPEQLNKMAGVLDVSPYVLKELEINTTSDIFAILVQICKKAEVKIEADKDKDGYCIPDTVSITLSNSEINNNLAVYKDMLDHRENYKNNSEGLTKKELSRRLDEIDENIDEAFITMVSDRTSLKESRKICDSVMKTKPDQFRKLEGIIVDCSSMELDFIIQSAKFIKKHSKKIKESN